MLTALAASSAMAADPPYVGKWKLNLEKSLVALVVTYEQDPGGGFKQTMLDESFTFKVDGKEYPALFGATAAWTAIDATTWEVVYKMDGKVLHTDRLIISADGATLTQSTREGKPGSETFNEAMVFHRVSEGAGLVGKWKYERAPMSGIHNLEIAAKGKNGLAFINLDHDVVCNAKFDGKDYAVKPAIVPVTCAIARKGDHSFTITYKVGPEMKYTVTFTSTDDTRSLSVTSTLGSVSTQVIYDRNN